MFVLFTDPELVSFVNDQTQIDCILLTQRSIRSAHTSWQSMILNGFKLHKPPLLVHSCTCCVQDAALAIECQDGSRQESTQRMRKFTSAMYLHAYSHTVRACSQDDPAMLLRESVRVFLNLGESAHATHAMRVLCVQMGVGADSTQKAFYSSDVNTFLSRPTMGIPRHFYEDNVAENTMHVLVAVDPAGGGASAFAVSSLVQLPSGSIVVRGQFPNRSPTHMSLITKHAVTKASGAWHECLKNRGTKNGNTLFDMSRANAASVALVSCSMKWRFTSSSECSANSNAARMHATSGALPFSATMCFSSATACVHAGDVS